MDVERRVEQLEQKAEEHSASISEIHTVLMGPGPNRDNGVNGTLKGLIKKFEEAMAWAHDVWNVRRREECLGLAEMKKVEERIEAMEKAATEIQVAKVSLRGVYVMGVLQFIGTVIAVIASR